MRAPECIQVRMCAQPCIQVHTYSPTLDNSADTCSHTCNHIYSYAFNYTRVTSRSHTCINVHVRTTKDQRVYTGCQCCARAHICTHMYACYHNINIIEHTYRRMDTRKSTRIQVHARGHMCIHITYTWHRVQPHVCIRRRDTNTVGIMCTHSIPRITVLRNVHQRATNYTRVHSSARMRKQVNVITSTCSYIYGKITA